MARQDVNQRNGSELRRRWIENVQAVRSRGYECANVDFAAGNQKNCDLHSRGMSLGLLLQALSTHSLGVLSIVAYRLGSHDLSKGPKIVVELLQIQKRPPRLVE